MGILGAVVLVLVPFSFAVSVLCPAGVGPLPPPPGVWVRAAARPKEAGGRARGYILESACLCLDERIK